MTARDPGALPVENCVAIIGMACYFPDASTPEEFWRNLASGRESVRSFDESSLRTAGVSDAELADPAYVRSGAPLDGFDTFDAGFFGLSPREAKVMDPQHRKLLECAWAALEDAGHTPASVGRNIGVYAGSGMHWYLLRNVMGNAELVREMGEFLVRHTANDKDFLATRVSYHLDLRGPSMSVQTACSTSLVAVHLACQSLLGGESDMALAGGSTIEVPHNVGYQYREEEIRSPDGHCRAMDAEAAGTVFGSGCGLVVLRRLQDALADGDTIHAVIRGSAINNDGADKAGYLAPSVGGQAQAIAEAIAVAGIAPETIGYVEAHGTGTRIGDPIEIAALTQGFGPTRRRQYCALGSVKSNVGHLDTAAGIAGLIKIALSMRHRKLPPSLHYHAPNPEIDFGNSPFHVNAELADWPELGAPLRAGISSLGVGGTNAHVVLEEAPPAASRPRAHAADDAICIVPLSARTPAALAGATTNLLAHLESHADLSLRDVAWTLRTGRVAFEHRKAVAGRGVADVVAQLRAVGRQARVEKTPPGVVFMFPGQGAQYPDMSRRLYLADPDFRSAMDACFVVLRGLGREDAIAALYPETVGADADAALRATEVTQPALFCVEYALAKALFAKGVRPTAMIGHSLGEYVAACLAGIFSLESALALVCRRGEMISGLPAGSMLGVAAGHRELAAYLSAHVALAGINAPESTVLSGDSTAIEVVNAQLAACGIGARRIPTSHAFHSQMLDPVVAPFTEAVAQAAPAAIDDSRIISNVTGTWLTAAQAGSAAYWASHLRQPVNFLGGLQRVAELGSVVFVEVGPGNTLSTFAEATLPDARTATCLPHPRDPTPDDQHFVAAGGMLWAHGVDIDWSAWGQPESGRRVPLPTYPFQRQRHWLEPGTRAVPASPDTARRPPEDWFHVTDWHSGAVAATGDALERVLVFSGTRGVGRALARALQERGTPVVTVEIGQRFAVEGSHIVIDPASDAEWDRLASEVGAFSHVAYLWPIDVIAENVAAATAVCFDHLLRIGRRIDRFGADGSGVKLLVVTANGHQLGGEAGGNPFQALVAGPARTIPQECPGVAAKWVDLALAAQGADETADQLMSELVSGFDQETVAWRHRRRFTPRSTRTRLQRDHGAPSLREGGCYLITGAFGGAGDALAQYLARRYRARLVLVARTALPAVAERDAYLRASIPGDTVRRRIQMVRRLESLGAWVEVIAADVGDGPALARAVDQLRLARLDGIFHAAGVLDDALMALKSRDATHRVLHPKIAGTLGLQHLLPLAPDFILYFSSLSAHTGVSGQVDYTAANAFLDAFAVAADARSTGTRHIAVDWSIWRDAGMAASLAARLGLAPAEPVDADLVEHPVLRSKTIDCTGSRAYFGMLTPESVWFLDQHRLRTGEAILPGTAYIDLIAAAMRDLVGRFAPLRIAGLVLSAPLLLQPREKRLLRIAIGPSQAGEHALTVSSLGADRDDVLEHASATISLLEHEACGSIRRLPPVAGLAPVTAPFSHPQLAFGPRWDCLTRMEASVADALVHLDLKTPDDLAQHPLHPALLDLAIGAAQSALSTEQLRGHLLPYRYGEILVLAPLTGSLVSQVRARAEDDRLVQDVDVCAPDGTLLLAVREFVLKTSRRAQARSPAGTRPRPAAPATANRILQAGFDDGLSNDEAMAVIETILASRAPAHVMVATRDLDELLRATRRAAPAVADVPAEGVAFLPRPEVGNPYVAPESELQCAMVAMWETMLEIHGIGIEDNFFELGGHSLLLTRLIARLNRERGIALPVEQAFEVATIAHWSGLAAAVPAPSAAAPARPITRVDRSKYKLSVSSQAT